MNSTLHLLFSKTKVYVVLFLSSLCMMATCKTDTDPNVVYPHLRLQIYDKDFANAEIDIKADGNNKPDAPAMRQVNPDGIVILATGTQMDRNVKNVMVRLRHLDVSCKEYSGPNSTGMHIISVPAVIKKEMNTPGGVPIQIVEYRLKDYAALFQCESGTLEVLVEVVASVTNVKDKETKLPPVILKMKYGASVYK